MPGRKITLKGIKPVGLEDWQFEYFWLYGLVEPLSGDSFFWEWSHFDSICFEQYLELFAQKFPEDLHIIQLDNGSPHQALELEIPENVILLFQPPYSPQINPIERLWKHLKKDLKWGLFEDLDALRNTIQKDSPETKSKSHQFVDGMEIYCRCCMYSRHLVNWYYLTECCLRASANVSYDNAARDVER